MEKLFQGCSTSKQSVKPVRKAKNVFLLPNISFLEVMNKEAGPYRRYTVKLNAIFY